MFKKIKNFLVKNYDYVIFFILLFLCLLFLIFQDGVWAYIDAQANIIKSNPLNLLKVFSQDTYFGIDNSFLNSFRWLYEFIYSLVKNIFSLKISSIFFYSIYFFINFYFSKKLLNIFFKNKFQEFLGSIFFTFNPVSLYFLNLPGYIFNYSSFIIFLYSIIKYFENKNIDFKYIFGVLFGINFILLYPRTAVIFFIIFLIYILFFYKTIFNSLKNKIKKIIIIGILIFFSLAPQINFVFSQFKEMGEADVLSFQKFYINDSEYIHEALKNRSFIENINIKEILPSFAKEQNNSLLFQLYNFIFLFFLLSVNIFIYKKIQDKNIKKIFIASIIIFGIFILFKNLALFINKEMYKFLTYKIFLFLAGRTDWPNFFAIYSLLFLIPVSFRFIDKKIQKIFILTFSVYIFLIIYPLVFYKNNIKLKTINENTIPNNYKTLQKENKLTEGALYFPGAENKFSWSPYAIFYLSDQSEYKNLFNRNARTGNLEQINFAKTSALLINKEYCKENSDIACKNIFIYNYCQKSFIKNNYINSKFFYYTKLINLKNYSLFGLKNILIYKDIENVKKNELDFFGGLDSVHSKDVFYKLLSKNKEVYKYIDEKEITIFKLNDSEKFNYLIYVPQTKINLNRENIFSKQIKTENNPILFDKENNIEVENNNINIEVKEAINNKTKYFVKLNNINNIDEFILQFNQTYSKDWSIKFINKKEYEKIKCENFINYEITKNKFCNYEEKLTSLFIVNYLKNDKTENIKGNYIANSFLTNKKQYEKYLDNNSLYVIIYFKKQFFYFYSIIISSSIFLLVLLLSFFQKFKIKFK